MITRGKIENQITKGGKMPKGPGTYGSKVGRPKKMGGGMMKKRQKFKSGTTAEDMTKKSIAVQEGRIGPRPALKYLKGKLIKGPHS